MQEETSILEESIVENMAENGVQRLTDIIIEQRSEDDTPLLHLELEDSGDTSIHEISVTQSEEIEQDVEEMVNNTSIKFACNYLIHQSLIYNMLSLIMSHVKSLYNINFVL